MGYRLLNDVITFGGPTNFFVTMGAHDNSPSKSHIPSTELFFGYYAAISHLFSAISASIT